MNTWVFLLGEIILYVSYASLLHKGGSMYRSGTPKEGPPLCKKRIYFTTPTLGALIISHALACKAI